MASADINNLPNKTRLLCGSVVGIVAFLTATVATYMEEDFVYAIQAGLIWGILFFLFGLAVGHVGQLVIDETFEKQEQEEETAEETERDEEEETTEESEEDEESEEPAAEPESEQEEEETM